MIVWRDGELVEADGAVSAADRGWLVGDAVFETILVVDGAPAFLDRHVARLNHGLETLRFERRLRSAEARRIIDDLVAGGAARGRTALRLAVSRAGGRRGLLPAAEAITRVTAFLAPIGAAPAGWLAVVADRRRWTGTAALGFKSPGSYLDNMLARFEAADAGADEAIMLNESGRVASATASNLFLAIGDRLATPPAAEGAMPGVVRGVLLEEAARLGIAASEEPIAPARLVEGTILLTNSVAGVVRTTLSRIGDGERSDAADQIIAAYEHRLTDELAANRSRA